MSKRRAYPMPFAIAVRLSAIRYWTPIACFVSYNHATTFWAAIRSWRWARGRSFHVCLIDWTGRRYPAVYVWPTRAVHPRRWLHGGMLSRGRWLKPPSIGLGECLHIEPPACVGCCYRGSNSGVTPWV